MRAIRYKGFIPALLLALAVYGCTPEEAAPATPTAAGVVEDAGEPAAPAEPDPKGAIEAVYAQEALADAQTETMDQERMKEILVNPGFQAEELYARYSDPRGGLADVVIAKPVSGEEESMINWLYRYGERRASEFENYDILDAYSIAQNAVIYQQGEYIVLLMLPDNEAAQYIIDQYIPQ